MVNGYKCLDLNPAFWRNGKAPSSIRYLRDGKNSRFRSQSKGISQSRSKFQSRDKYQSMDVNKSMESLQDLETKVDNLTKEQKNLQEIVFKNLTMNLV